MAYKNEMANSTVAKVAETVFRLAARTTRSGKWGPKGKRVFQILSKAALEIQDLAKEPDGPTAGDLVDNAEAEMITIRALAERLAAQLRA